MKIMAPIAIGELIDKITILEIKEERILDPDKRRNVTTELQILREIKSLAGLDTAEMKLFSRELKSLNTTIWDIEDTIRELEAQHDFGPRFVELARSIYLTNDRRAHVKNAINRAFVSEIIEEKSYKG